MKINFLDATIFSIGSLGKNNSEDQVSNILVDQAIISNTTNGVRIKSWQVKYHIQLPYAATSPK